MKRYILVLLAALCLAACGSTETGPDTPADSVTVTTAQTAADSYADSAADTLSPKEDSSLSDSYFVYDEGGMEMLKIYQQISQEEAKALIAEDNGHIIVDVRRHDEFAEGHIPGAVCIPNESIGDEMPSELPERGQIILVYCRSGRRSKEAAQKLADMGYTRVYEFGGIIDWTGDVVTDGASES